MPAMLVFIANWFTKSERSRANTFLILGNPVTVLWMSVVSGYLVNSFGWRHMFIAEGVPAIVWAVIWWFIVKDKPAQVNWLSEQEKKRSRCDAARRAGCDQAGEELSRGVQVAGGDQAVRAVFLLEHRRVWLRAVAAVDPEERFDARHGRDRAGCPRCRIWRRPSRCLLASWASDKLQARKAFVWPFLLIGAVAFAGSYLLGSTNFWASYALLVIAGAAMYAPYGPFFAIVPELLPKNVAGGAMALINSMGALGSFVGSYFVGYLNGATGSPAASYVFMSAALLLACGLRWRKPQMRSCGCCRCALDRARQANRVTTDVAAQCRKA